MAEANKNPTTDDNNGNNKATGAFDAFAPPPAIQDIVEGNATIPASPEQEPESTPAENAANQTPEGDDGQKQQNKQDDLDSAVAAEWVSAQMASVSNCLTNMKKMFNTNPNYTVYISFSMNGLTVSTVTSSSENNLIMSLEVDNNGSGYANEFTLQIAWAPSVNSNCNWLEERLLGGNYNGENFSSMYCQLTYGYANGVDIKTRSFMGIVTNYTVDLQDEMLIYTITGYSSIVALNESKDPISIEMTEEEETNGICPTAAVKRIVQKYLQGEGTATAADSEGTSVSITRCPVNKNVKYDIKFLGDCYTKDKPTVLTTQLDKNISQAISDILNKAVDAEQAEKTEKEDVNISNLNRSYYSWFIDDTATTSESGESFTGTIYVYRLTAEQRKNADATIIFNWMAPGSSSTEDSTGAASTNYDWLVKNFRPEYKGSVLLSIASDILNPKKASSGSNANSSDDGGETGGGEGTGSDGSGINDGADTEVPDTPDIAEMEEAFNGSYYLDNNGKLCTTQKSISPPIGGTAAAANSSIEQERSTWLVDVQYPYKATLTTLGVPALIPITGIIKIVPIIYTTPHHSQGKYLITGTKDLLNSSVGYETTWELMKIDTAIEGEDTNINSGNGEERDPNAVDYSEYIKGYTESGVPKFNDQLTDEQWERYWEETDHYNITEEEFLDGRKVYSPNTRYTARD